MIIIRERERERERERRLTEGSRAYTMKVSGMRVSIDIDLNKVIDNLKYDMKAYGLHKLQKNKLVQEIISAIDYHMMIAADNDDHQLAQFISS